MIKTIVFAASLTVQQECLVDRLGEWMHSDAPITVESVLQSATAASQVCGTEMEEYFDDAVMAGLCAKDPDIGRVCEGRLRPRP